MGVAAHIQARLQRSRLCSMEGNTRQLIEVLVALSPYVLFVAMIIWAAVAELMEERQRPKIASKQTDKTAPRTH